MNATLTIWQIKILKDILLKLSHERNWPVLWSLHILVSSRLFQPSSFAQLLDFALGFSWSPLLLLQFLSVSYHWAKKFVPLKTGSSDFYTGQSLRKYALSLYFHNLIETLGPHVTQAVEIRVMFYGASISYSLTGLIYTVYCLETNHLQCIWNKTLTKVTAE